MIRFIFYAAVIFFAYIYFKKLQKRNDENKRLSGAAGYYIEYYLSLNEEDKEQFKKYMSKDTEKTFNRFLKRYAVNKKVDFSKLSSDLKIVIDNIRQLGIFNTLKSRLSLFNMLDKGRKDEILDKISEQNRALIRLMASRHKTDGVLNKNVINLRIYKNAISEFIEATNSLVKEYASIGKGFVGQPLFTEGNSNPHVEVSAASSGTGFDMLSNDLINNDMIAMQMTGVLETPPMMVMDAYGGSMHEIGSADLSIPNDIHDFEMGSGMMSCDMYGSGMHEFGAPDLSSPMDSGFDNNMF